MKREDLTLKEWGEIPQRKKNPIIFAEDEFIKPNTTKEGLAGLRAAFKKDGSVTAGNSSGLNDGAVALLIASGDAVKEHQLQPLARVVASAVAGVEPRIMGIGPVEASKKALDKAGLTLDDMDVIELNEAFAAQVLACIRALGLADDDSRINPNGGAIALGHPLGVTGRTDITLCSVGATSLGKEICLGQHVYWCRSRLRYYFRTRLRWLFTNFLNLFRSFIRRHLSIPKLM